MTGSRTLMLRRRSATRTASPPLFVSRARATRHAAARHVVAVVGDGALTGGMAYEALNNLGHSGARVLVVLNDNGRSYAPTVSRLSVSLTQLRLDPRYLQVRDRVRHLVEDLPGGVSSLAFTSFHGLSAAIREVVEPRMFFEALGIRYTGPIDGHDIGALEQALRRAASWQGPIVLHVVTTKGKGYAPAEADEIACLHDLKPPAPPAPPSRSGGHASARPGSPQAAGSQVNGSTDDDGLPGPLDAGESYAEVFSSALVELAAADERIVAITAAMPGPTGLLAFQDRYPGALHGRRHRRAARAHSRGWDGDERPATGRRHLLDVSRPSGGPVEPRHRAAQAAGRDLRRPGGGHRG